MTRVIHKRERKLKKWEVGRIVVPDNSICSGCRSCETACALSHEGVANPLYSRIEVRRHVLSGAPSEIFACAQCEGAPCAKACPKGAIETDAATKAKVVNEERCIGCGICIQACIVSPPRIAVVKEEKRAIKCDLCGGSPQCVAVCPMGALAYKEVER